MDKISVIVPVYNIAPYIERCVNSICLQSHTNLEIILVNDGSTDNSQEILQGLALRDPRIVVINKDNSGVTSARLEGLKNASGAWISFIDGDDYIESNMYEKLLSNACRYNADISHCGYKMMIKEQVNYFYNTKEKILQNNEKGIIDLFEAKYIEPTLCTKIFKRNLFKDLINLIDVEIIENEDLLMNYYLFRNSNCSIFEDFCPYHYIVRKGSATQSESKNIQRLKDSIKVLCIIKNDCTNPVMLKILNKRLLFRFLNYIEYDETSEIARKEIKQILLEQEFDSRIKYMAKLAITSPYIYNLIHKIFRILKGNINKYKC